ncbi:hybrid sensor histidine kinase/response regulator transcription factor [Chitinophaga sp. Cy-1792]|uniref:hybrid sensor histidine kinase/response regulator transcription factor n=1 Tax=Chitinophaga sp. Cy-1792 TaxID=2608339 RepID=UPI00141D7967|nr:hybrid sensor histidine kinase/response regulator transcription factor [Chitinophaga sp. Cy-1792]
MMPKSTFLLLLLLACLRMNGQELLFNHLTSEEGLDPGAVLCIARDNNGFMWFGTQNGLDRYDTRRFMHYKSPLSKYIDVPENYFTHLLADSRHQLWVGTRNGLNKYNPVTDQLDLVTLTDKPGKNNLSISCIYEDRQGNLWIWSSEGLFKQTNGQSGSFQLVPVPDSVAGLAENNNLRTIYQDYTGAYWIGSSLGLTRMTFNKGQAVFRSYRHSSQNKESLSDNYVTVIIGDNENRLWIGTQQGGLNYFDPLKQSFRRYESGGGNGLINNNIRDITIDSLGRLWIGTQGGISIFSPGEERFLNYHSDPEQVQSLSHNSVYSIFLDHHGTAWIGTYWGGVNSVAVNNTPFHIYRTGSYPQGINNNVVSAIAEDAVHNLWVGTEGGGLNYLNSATQQATVFRHNAADSNSLGSDLVKMIYKDTDGNFWVGTHGGGLNVFNPATKNFTRFFYKDNDPVVRSSEVLSMLESRDGICWIGMQTGLLAFKRTGRTLSKLPDNHLTGIVGKNSIKAMLQASNGDIWVGTSVALFLLPHGTQNVLRFTVKDSLPRNNINCIQEDAAGNIWIGCAFGGLARYMPNGSNKKFEVYTKESGLPDDNITAIRAAGHNNLWISTGNGLCKLDAGRMVFKNYNKSDGLAGNIFNINSSCITSDGRLMFGGYNGITFFHPEEIKENLYAPKTFLTGLKLFDQTIAVNTPDKLLRKEISQTEHIRFTAQQNVFTLEFATLNYVQSDKNVYAYTLDGFDKEWNYSTTPSATYMNLPAGEYDFLAKGSNNDGIWGPPVRLHITVLPPIWKTWLAYILYTLLLIAIGFFVIRFFVLRSLIRKDKELTRLKLDFFTNISHEMRSRLSLIIGPAEKLLLINKEDYENTRQLQIIRKNSESLLHLITELMDFRKAESGNLALQVTEQDIVACVREIFYTFEDRALSMNIQHEFVCPSPVVIPFDREQLEKVFYNLFYNAYKFTPSGGSISATITDQKDVVVVSIQDTGRGVSPENLPKLFTNYFQEDDQGSDNKGYGIGLALAKSIIELHGGTISVNSTRTEKGNTTVFTVTLRKGYRPVDQVVKQQAFVETIDKISFPMPGVASLEPATDMVAGALPVGEKKYTVLLIEDNAEILQFNREVLEKSYNVITSSNGNDGWEVAVDTIPDIIVSDVMMPGMDGYTLCNRLKTDERTDHIPVILLTAMSTSAQQLSGLQKGADVYLTKPYSIHMLVLHISNLLSLREKIHARLAKQLVSDTGVVVPAFEEAPDVIQDPFLMKVIEIIEENMEEPGFGVDIISRKLAMSRPVLYKKLNMLTGVTVNDFIKAIRMKKAVSYLGEGIYNISEVAYKVGYSDPKYFSKEFKKHFGKSPREWKKGE